MLPPFMSAMFMLLWSIEIFNKEKPLKRALQVRVLLGQSPSCLRHLETNGMNSGYLPGTELTVFNFFFTG